MAMDRLINTVSVPGSVRDVGEERGEDTSESHIRLGAVSLVG